MTISLSNDTLAYALGALSMMGPYSDVFDPAAVELAKDEIRSALKEQES